MTPTLGVDRDPEVCCVGIYVLIILYIFWESWDVASRSYTMWTLREGLPLTVGGQKPLTITERDRDPTKLPASTHKPPLVKGQCLCLMKLHKRFQSHSMKIESKNLSSPTAFE